MSRSRSSIGLGWRFVAVVLWLGIVPACADIKSKSIDEVTATTAETALTATLQNGASSYVGTRDTYLNQSSASSNYGNKTTLYVDGDDPAGTGRDLSALLYFDLSNIPTNALVTGATLTLYVTDATPSGYPIYALNRDWVETQVNWTRAASGTNWATAGALGAADRGSTELASVAASSTGFNSVSLNASGVAQVQNWVTTPANNHGFIIASSSLTDKFAFYSSEIWYTSWRPKFVVNYTVPSPECVAPGCCTGDAACNDGNACTTDACANGVCGFATVTGCCRADSDCADDGNACTTDSCVANACQHSALSGCCIENADCSDGNLCTSDACANNACSNVAIVGCCNADSDCSDGNACTTDVCSNNVCSVAAVVGCCAADVECADANVCTADACVANRCVHNVLGGCCNTDSECNDSDPCTTDRCADTACSHSLVVGGACGCNVNTDCNDNRDCTSDTCVAGTCRNAEATPGACGCQSDIACDDANPCTIDTCKNAACSNVVANCSDGNPATTDQCVDGYCAHVVSTPITRTFRNGENSYLSASDTRIAQGSATTNYEGGTVLVVDGDETSGNDVATVMRWGNLELPAGAVITSATVTLNIGGGTDSGSATAYQLYALTRGWDSAVATWERADYANNWGASGALNALDRDSTVIGSTPTATTGSAVITLNASGVARVQAWIDEPSTNFGLVISNSTNTDGLYFYSSEFATVSSRPMLSVTYSGWQTVTDPVSVASSGNSPRYGFFVYSDSHVEGATNPPFSSALAQMNELRNADGAPPILAAMSLGDHTENGLDASWDWHTGMTSAYWDATATAFGGTRPRYIAVPGNHDVLDGGNWYSYWVDHLPGQVSLGGNSSSAGVYYSFNYDNALFVGLDTNKATNTSTAYANDAQIKLARTALVGSVSPFKFMFYHMPAFYCGSSGGGANASSVAFVDLAAQNNVDVIFNGHSHVYSRTCRMTKAHVCTNTTSGTVQVEVGTVGATDARLRGLKTTAQSVTGYDASGVSVATSYTCNTANGYAATLGSQRTFCYVNVRGCWANVSCYRVGTATPFDSWSLNHCQ